MSKYLILLLFVVSAISCKTGEITAQGLFTDTETGQKYIVDTIMIGNSNNFRINYTSVNDTSAINILIDQAFQEEEIATQQAQLAEDERDRLVEYIIYLRRKQRRLQRAKEIFN